MAQASEMAMLTVDLLGNPVTEHSHCRAFCTLVRSHGPLNQQCLRCDSWGGLEAARRKQPFVYRCHMGLLDLAVPLLLEGQYVGAIMAGQVVIANPEEASQLEVLADSRRVVADLGLTDELELLRRDVPVMGLGRVRAIARMMFQVSNYIVDEALQKTRLIDSSHLPRIQPTLLQPALDYLKENYDQDVSVDQAARLCGISSSYFSKLFNSAMGEGLAAYVNRLRVSRAQVLLREGGDSITAVAFQLGFEDSGYFNRVFKKVLGITPSQYRHQALGAGKSH